jgi:hypothetical protein
MPKGCTVNLRETKGNTQEMDRKTRDRKRGVKNGVYRNAVIGCFGINSTLDQVSYSSIEIWPL